MNSALAPATSLPRSRMLAPFAMTTPMPSAGLPFWRATKRRRIDEAVRDGGDVAEPEHPAVRFDRRFRDRLDAVERAGDAQRHALRGRLDRAGRDDAFCLRERIEQRLRRNSERRQLGMRELDEDLLVLGAVEIDLGDARHLEEAAGAGLRRPFSAARKSAPSPVSM